MLKYLYIKDFILIDELEIEFSSGLNILTGETGAGKTIIIDALNVVLGERVTAECIRPGTTRAIIKALFEIEHGQLKNDLQEYGFDIDEQYLILQREILNTGKHICRVNGQIFTLGVLTDIGKRLVDLHGQHQHQSLLNSNTQLKLLDRYGNLQDHVEKTAVLYKQTNSLIYDLHNLTVNEKEKTRQLDLLRFELEEINQANLQVEKDSQLEAEIKILRNAEKIHRLTNESCQFLSESENNGIISNLYQVIKRLTLIEGFDQTATESLNIAQETYYQLEKLSEILTDYLHHTRFDPNRLEEVESRLNLITKLKYKYGQTIEEILSYAQQAEKKINTFIHQEEEIERITKEINMSILQLEPLANQLSVLRKEVSQTLQSKIMNELADLGIKKTVFEINLHYKRDDHSRVNLNGQPTRINANGFDNVEFFISTNPGQPLKPLANIASGGELSRIMLAIKTILAQVDEISTLIFDEIDNGVGGQIAQKVGQKLKHISQLTEDKAQATVSPKQVICITHLPQIAAYAQTHFYVEKCIIGEKTQTRVKKLNRTEQIRELALLLGGSISDDGHEISETSLKHAEEILEKAR